MKYKLDKSKVEMYASSLFHLFKSKTTPVELSIEQKRKLELAKLFLNEHPKRHELEIPGFDLSAVIHDITPRQKKENLLVYHLIIQPYHFVKTIKVEASNDYINLIAKEKLKEIKESFASSNIAHTLHKATWKEKYNLLSEQEKKDINLRLNDTDKLSLTIALREEGCSQQAK